MAKINSRIPLIALDYSERHKAQKKEILIDYENGGNIYVVSAESKEIIYDITAKIAEKVEGITGDKIEIEIEGVGVLNLTEVLNQMRLELNNSVQAIDAGDTVYMGKENVLDDKSLDANNRYVQLKGFDAADKYMIPRKGLDGQLEWVYPNVMPDDDNSNGGTGGGGIIPNPDPDDGVVQGVYLIEPIGDKLYLRATRRQKSKNIPKNCLVVLPKIIDTFSEIEWYVKTNSFAPMFKFSENVIWDNATKTQPRPDSHQVYKFKTWDSGETWLGELVLYNTSVNIVIDKDYLDKNYYDKHNIVDKYYDKPQVNEIAKTIVEMIPEGGGEGGNVDLSNYYNKTEVDEKDKAILDKIPEMDDYYNKTEVDEKDKAIVDSIPSNLPNMEDYYNKTEVDEKDKAIIDSIPSNLPNMDDYYNKEQVDNKDKTIISMIPDMSKYYDRTEVDEKDKAILDSIPSNLPNMDDYYNKTHIDDNFYSKTEVDEKDKAILDKIPENIPNMDDYYNKTHIDDNFYNKTEVESRIDEINAVDPKDYYNKLEISDKFYTKEQIEDQHYNKSEVDDKFKWVSDPTKTLSDK